MLRAILIIGIGFSVIITLGVIIGIWECYLQRQLNTWREQMTKQHVKRQAKKVINKPTPPEGG